MADGGKPNKAALLLAIGGKPKGPAGREPMGSEPEMGGDMGAESDIPGGDEVKDMAAADAMAAFESGDVKALSVALTDFVKACQSEDY